MSDTVQIHNHIRTKTVIPSGRGKEGGGQEENITDTDEEEKREHARERSRGKKN